MNPRKSPLIKLALGAALVAVMVTAVVCAPDRQDRDLERVTLRWLHESVGSAEVLQLGPNDPEGRMVQVAWPGLDLDGKLAIVRVRYRDPDGRERDELVLVVNGEPLLFQPNPHGDAWLER